MAPDLPTPDLAMTNGLSLPAPRRIYMCVFALPESGSMVGKVRGFGHEHLLPLAFEFAADDSYVDRDPGVGLVGSGIEDAEGEAHFSTLGRWNGRCMD